MFEAVVVSVLNKFLGDYVENFQANQLNIAIWNGDIKLKNLRLKDEALSKLKLPMDFKEGYLGELTMKIPWHNLKNLPVAVSIKNVYLLISPKDVVDLDPKEEEERSQKLKQEKLETSELMLFKNNTSQEEDAKQSSFTTQLVTKILDNLQVSIENIHLRYEDSISNPGHLFAIGVTLSQISAVSTDENWNEAIIDSASKVIHKLLTLKKFGIYWNTETKSLGGKSVDDAIRTFMGLIPNEEDNDLGVQYILEPVSALGKLVVDSGFDTGKTKNKANLEFDQFNLILDNEQYRDLMLTTSMFDLVMRKQKYIKYEPPSKFKYSEKPVEWFRFAARCVLDEIHQKRRQWTWEYFAERRDDRNRYKDLYTKLKLQIIDEEGHVELKALERKLKFSDIKFYRSLSLPEINRKKAILQKAEEAQRQASWLGSWLTWDSGEKKEEDPLISEEQMQQLYETIDYDEDVALQVADLPREFVFLALQAQLKKGSFILRSDPHGAVNDIISLNMKNFSVDFLQRVNSFKAKLQLNELELLDGSDSNTIYPKLIKVSEEEVSKELTSSEEEEMKNNNPFFDLVYENNPLSGNSDNAISLKMRNLQIIYNPSTVNTVVDFFKPPKPAYDSVSALIEAAGNKLEGLKKQTTASLQYALEEHKTLDLLVDIKAPLIIVPHSFTDSDSQVVLLDSGHISMDSKTIDKVKRQEVQEKHIDEFTEKDFKSLESMMYDKFDLELTSVQLVAGNSLTQCLEAVQDSKPAGDLHIVDRINVKFSVLISILPQVTHLTKVCLSGHLPILKVNFSDHKYKALMSTIDLILPSSNDTKANQNLGKNESGDEVKPISELSTAGIADYVFSGEDVDFSSKVLNEPTENQEDDEEFFDAEDKVDVEFEAKFQNLNQKLFVLDFKIDKLKASIRKADQDINHTETELADAHLDGFSLHVTQYPYHMDVDIAIKTVNIFDKLNSDAQFTHLITSEDVNEDKNKEGGKDLMKINYIRANSESPEFVSRFNEINQMLDVSFSKLYVIVTQKSILSLYNFILVTFTSNSSTDNQNDTSVINSSNEDDKQEEIINNSTIMVKTRMDSIHLILNDDGYKIATINLYDGDLTVLMTHSSLRLDTKLKNLSIIDNTDEYNDLLKENQYKLLSIDTKEVAEIRYESFNNKSLDLGYDSLVHINIGALRLLFLEEQFTCLLSFFSRFAEMHLLFETARQAAMNSASQLQEQVNRLKFEISIKSPKVIFPKNSKSKDFITANLGELIISNNFSNNTELKNDLQILNTIQLQLSSIFLSSSIEFEEFNQNLQIIEDISLDLKVILCDYIKSSSRPEKEIVGSLAPVSLKLTRKQYELLMDVFNSTMRVINGNPEQQGSVHHLNDNNVEENKEQKEAEKDIKNNSNKQEDEIDDLHNTLDAVFSLEKVYLELYDGENPEELSTSKLAELSLNNTSIKYLAQSNGITEMESEIHSFVVLDSRTDFKYPFREIIPAITHEGPQFMAHISTKPNSPATYLITIDSPKVVLSVEFLLAIQNFILSPFQDFNENISDVIDETDTIFSLEDSNKPVNETNNKPQVSFFYRVNVVDAEVIVLADIRNPSSEAIVLSIQQIVMSQQGVLSLVVDRIGMSLCQMNSRQKSSLRFIDNFDIILSLNEQINKGEHSVTDIYADIKPLILRLSYRDLMLITDVINKFTKVFYSTSSDKDNKSKKEVINQPLAINTSLDRHNRTLSMNSTFSLSSSTQTYYQVINRETLKVTIQGLQVILIRDAYDLPIIDINTEPFTINVSDWSTHLKAELQLQLNANFFNLKNSHWEPLIEPWSLSSTFSKPSNESSKIELQSKKLLDFNVTPAIIETMLSFFEEIKESGPLDTPRGIHIPYIIRNRTGYAMHIWGDINGGDSSSISLKRIPDGEDLNWRFYDWKETRENLSQGRNCLGLQFENVTWESLKDIIVDQEGVTTYQLRPLLMGVAHRLVCEVKLKNNVKIVTFRSPLVIENASLLPMEMVVVDSSKKHLSSITIIQPGDQCSVPIESAYRFGLLVRPHSGFGYDWCNQYFYWREFLIDAPVNTLICPSLDKEISPFHIQIHGQFNVKDPMTVNYPCITFKLSAPMELENLLPYDLRFNFYWNNNQNEYNNFLKRGGISPIHEVDVRKSLEMSLQVWDTEYQSSKRILIKNPNKSIYDNNNNNNPIIQLIDNNGMELILFTSIKSIPKSGGSFKLSIYCPYILLNKTGVDMYFKTNSHSRQTRIASGNDDLKGKKILPHMFSYGLNENRKRAFVKIGQSEWSHPVSFEASGSVSELILKSIDRPEQIHLGVSIEDGLGKFCFTRLVSFTPRFIIKNNLNTNINFREFTATTSSIVRPNESTPLYFLSQLQNKMLTICYPGLNNLWSAPFKIDTVGKIHVQLSKINSGIELIKVDVQLQGATIFIILEKETGKWPFRIENMTESNVVFYQAVNRDKVLPGFKEPNRYKLACGKAVPYSWDFPSVEDKVLNIAVGPSIRQIDFQQIGALMPFRYHSDKGMKIMSIDVIAEGTTQVLKLSKYIEAESLYRPTRINSTSSILNRTQSQSQSQSSSSVTSNNNNNNNHGFEVIEKDGKVLFFFSLKLEGIGISVINKRHQELMYCSLKDIDLKFKDYLLSQSLKLIIKWIQIDNQLFGSIYPILLFPTVISKSGNESNLHPTFHMVLSRDKDLSHGVESIKYFTILLQEMSFEIDEDFLYSLLDFAKHCLPQPKQIENEEEELFNINLEIPQPSVIIEDTKIYFSLLHIQPLKLSLSFMRTEHNDPEDVQPQSSNPLNFIVNVLTMAIGSINDAPIKFNSLVLENLLADYSVLLDRLTSYYGQEFIYQIHKIVGSADVIGNPVGLFNNLSSGVVDIFYEPYQGFVMSDRPQDFGIGLARGTASFVKKTVFGLSDSFSKITGSLGKGLAEVTMDKAFIDRRRLNKTRNKPKHALYGVAQGANSLGSSVASGISGVVLQPIEGAERDGVSGFFRGVGKGLVGVVAKPMVGAFDLVSNVAEGIRNTTTVFDTDSIDRIRLPRYIAPDGILRPYSSREALGQKWLQEFKEGKYFSEKYLAHYSMKNSQTVVMLTSNRVLQIKVRNLSLDWELPFSELQSVQTDGNSITFISKFGGKRPFIEIPEQSSRRWFASRIDEAFDLYLSAHRPME
ncbi:vacuolar protein sorting-associated protein vps13 [Neoconidiobolus thromboides FSU 785]|nr:vacuolar protein sorting-associated protein vps13 [Neoconidiobolus thromboides FSU 785]